MKNVGGAGGRGTSGGLDFVLGGCFVVREDERWLGGGLDGWKGG